MIRRILFPLILAILAGILLFFTKANPELFRINVMFLVVFLAGLIIKLFNLKRLDE